MEVFDVLLAHDDCRDGRDIKAEAEHDALVAATAVQRQRADIQHTATRGDNGNEVDIVDFRKRRKIVFGHSDDL
jgi:hypothetical protein